MTANDVIWALVVVALGLALAAVSGWVAFYGEQDAHEETRRKLARETLVREGAQGRATSAEKRAGDTDALLGWRGGWQ